MKRTMVFGFLVFLLALPHAQQPSSAQADKSSNPQQEKAPPVVLASPGSLSFGDQVTKKASKPQRITITNTGEKQLYINSVTMGGDNREDFAVVSDTCTGATVASQKSCVIDVSFTPVEVGGRKAELGLMDNAADSPQKIALTGNGINSARVPPSRSPR